MGSCVAIQGSGSALAIRGKSARRQVVNVGVFIVPVRDAYPKNRLEKLELLDARSFRRSALCLDSSDPRPAVSSAGAS